MSGVVWKTVTEVGKTFKKGESVTVLEVSKSEKVPIWAINIHALSCTGHEDGNSMHGKQRLPSEGHHQEAWRSG